MTARSRRIRRACSMVAYLGFARHLPWSPRPGGQVARRLRARLARGMLDVCGDDVNIEHGAWFGSGRGVEVGDRSDLGMDCLVMGPLTVGADVMMGPRCTLIASAHATADLTTPMNTQGFAPERRIVIDDDVWIGAGSTILPGVRVGRGAIIGAGAVVVKDVPPYTLVAGNPAVVKRHRSPGLSVASDG